MNSNLDVKNDRNSNSSNHSSAGSSDSEDSSKTPMQKHNTINEEDEEYSNIYRFAKENQHKKLMEREKQSSFNKLEPVIEHVPTENIEEPHENSSFLSYLVVPVYNWEENKEESEVETVTSSFVRYHKPLGKTKNYITTLKEDNGLDRIEVQGNMTQLISNNHIGMVIEEDKDDSKYEMSSRSNSLNKSIRADTIGEAYFETSKLKGWKKFYFVYLILISWIRFVFFRVKRPVKCVSFLIIMYISLIFIDIFITFNLFLHMKTESNGERIFSGIGIYYFFFYPGISIFSPLFGLVSQVFCKTSFFKIYVMINSISWISNLLLTLVFQIIHEDKFYYIVEVLIVLFIRIIWSNLANFQISIFEYRKSVKATYLSTRK